MTDARRVGDLLAQRASSAIVGRGSELEVLLGVLEDAGALVTHLHGLAGIGKSTLLAAFAHQARAQGAVVVPPRSDIFSLGTMLYEMTVGRNPFRGESPSETVARILATECDPPSSLRPDLSAELEAVICRCLEKLPAERYADAGELLADLQRVSSGDTAD